MVLCRRISRLLQDVKQNFDLQVMETYDGDGPSSVRHILLPVKELVPSAESLVSKLRLKACVQVCLLHALRGLSSLKSTPKVTIHSTLMSPFLFPGIHVFFLMSSCGCVHVPGSWRWCLFLLSRQCQPKGAIACHSHLFEGSWLVFSCFPVISVCT